jgi:integrase
LISLADGKTVLKYRDRAILKFYLYTGVRLESACRLKVSDFHKDDKGATIRISEKGAQRRTIGLHRIAANAIEEYAGCVPATS